MKLPLIWLKEYIDPRMATDKLAEALTMSGSKVEGVDNKLGEPIIEIEVTTNRPDCLSLLGLANEVAALSGKIVKTPQAYKDLAPAKKNARTVDITIEDKRGCPRYTARVIEGVRVAPAPEKIRKVLELMGTRPISNVVDATNFVLFECGQPLHAFDIDKLRGGRIVVRRSKKGEKFLGIDGVEYTLDDETLVIADASGPVAIAGVMGGKLTEVTDETKNILLESAFFDPAAVRRAGKKYKLTTESSYRFERRVNPDNVPYASQRAAELIMEWAGGRDTSALIDKDHQEKGAAGKVALRLDRMEKILGMKVPQTRVSQIFRSLSLETHPAGHKVVLDRTGFRDDLKIEEDLIEEV
ncbi:MAG TPA: phenylalanine--tRNA ligase subunit beta, partial [Candidatus Omnitrophota bacterium]|nr:phenylalanine--tRNA ligase subunit beta [Candidatus Omnitrophota bacterium]